MNRSRRGGWGWPLLTLLCGLMCVAVHHASIARSRSEPAILHTMSGWLSRVLRSERNYHRLNHAYASSLEELGLEGAAPRAWDYQLIGTRIRGQSILLVEAGFQGRRLCIARDGRMYSSSLQPLPPIAPWRPATEGDRDAAAC